MSAGGHGFNFIEAVVGGSSQVIVSAVLVAGLLVWFANKAAQKLQQAQDPLLPEDKLTIRSLFELVALFILRLGDNIMGKENRKYLPFLGTVFIYIAAMNLLGLIPGFSMPTSNLAFNGGIGLVVFLSYNIWGIKEVGVIGYLKHMCGPIWWVGGLVFLVELVSHLVRPISLSLRLYGNMTGDHMVLGIFTELTRVGIPIIFYGLGTFVCLMQAFVFTLLTMIYIRFAVAHEEEHVEGADSHH